MYLVQIGSSSSFAFFSSSRRASCKRRISWIVFLVLLVLFYSVWDVAWVLLLKLKWCWVWWMGTSLFLKNSQEKRSVCSWAKASFRLASLRIIMIDFDFLNYPSSKSHPLSLVQGDSSESLLPLFPEKKKLRTVLDSFYFAFYLCTESVLLEGWRLFKLPSPRGDVTPMSFKSLTTSRLRNSGLPCW